MRLIPLLQLTIMINYDGNSQSKSASLPFDFVSLQLQYLVLHLPETKESFQINLTIKKVTTLSTAILKLKLRLISNGYLKKTFGKTPGHALFVCLFVSSFDTF